MVSSINSFSKTSKLILMIFGAKWSWESACFVSVVSGWLRWVESSENFQSSKNACFFFVQTPKMEANVLVDPWWLYLKNHLECIEIMNIHPSYSLSLFCILLKLYTTKFQSKRSSLRCDPLEQENLAQKPGMKMLTVGWLKVFEEKRSPCFLSIIIATALCQCGRV